MKIKNILFFPVALIRLILLFLISTYVALVGWIWLSTKGFSNKLQRWVLQTWGKSCLFVLGIKINHNKLPSIPNFIIMPNHRSYLDIFVVAALIPATMVSKEEIKNWPLGKLGAKITNLILVNRSELKSLIQTMNRIKESVKSGFPVILFPEGGTFKGPLTKKFKNGSFQIAAEARIPVIPTAINYKDENDAWVGNDTFLPHFFRQMGKPATRVDIQFGEPVSGNDHKKIQTLVKGQIDTMLMTLNDNKAV
jgi:1-acyl-sn-glycerol-3-phosphate acyltransferase